MIEWHFHIVTSLSLPARFPYDRLNGSLDRLNGPLAAIQLLREITRGKESISAEFQGSADKFQPSTRMHSQVKKKWNEMKADYWLWDFKKLTAYNFLKKKTSSQIFSCEFSGISEAPFKQNICGRARRALSLRLKATWHLQFMFSVILQFRRSLSFWLQWQFFDNSLKIAVEIFVLTLKIFSTAAKMGYIFLNLFLKQHNFEL